MGNRTVSNKHNKAKKQKNKHTTDRTDTRQHKTNRRTGSCLRAAERLSVLGSSVLLSGSVPHSPIDLSLGATNPFRSINERWSRSSSVVVVVGVVVVVFVVAVVVAVPVEGGRKNLAVVVAAREEKKENEKEEEIKEKRRGIHRPVLPSVDSFPPGERLSPLSTA
jgi:hypothetical protein